MARAGNQKATHGSPFYYNCLMRIPVITVLLLLPVLLLQGCKLIEQHINKPSVAFSQTTFQHVSLQQGVLKSTVRLSNPNDFSLPVKTLTYHLHLNQQKFAHSQLRLDKNIPAHGTVEFELPVTIRYQQLLDGLVSALSHQKITFRLNGEVDFGLLTIPYQKTGDFVLR